MTKMTSLRIPDELHDEIKERAKKSLMLPSEYIRQILRNHIESTTQDTAKTKKKPESTMYDIESYPHFDWYKDTPKFKCSHCGRHFWGKESYISLRRHLVREHNVEKKEIQILYDI